jgi:hypothetical protein
MLAAGPPRSGTVLRAHRDGVVRVRGPVVREQPLVVPDRGRERVGHDEPGGREIARVARGLERRERGLRAVARRQVRDAVEVGVHLLVLLRRQCGHRLRIIGRELRELLRRLDGTPQRFVRDVVRGDDRVLLPERALDDHGEVRDPASRGHLIVGEPHVRRVPAADVHLDALGLRHLRDPVDERLRLVAAQHGSVRNVLDQTLGVGHGYLCFESV